MAHHLSALKRIRQTSKRRLANRYYKKSARTAIKNLREEKDQAKAQDFLPKVVSMIDKLAKRGTIHANKASNLKSGLMKHINHLAPMPAGKDHPVVAAPVVETAVAEVAEN